MGRCVIVFIGLNAILLILHTPHDPVASGSILSVKNFLKIKVIIFFLIFSISHLIQFSSVLFYFIAQNHNKSCLMALYIIKVNTSQLYKEKTQQSYDPL